MWSWDWVKRKGGFNDAEKRTYNSEIFLKSQFEKTFTVDRSEHFLKSSERNK